MNAFNELVKQEADKAIKNSACVFSAPCVVVSVLENQKYVVKLITNNAQYTVVNYSGSNLEVGESAQLFYRNNIISEQTAYIGASLTKDSGGGGGGSGYTFVEKTQAQYDAMSTHDSKTVYFIVDSPSETEYNFTEKTQTEYDEMASHDPNTVYFIIGS